MFKNVDGFIYGASIQTDENGVLNFSEYGREDDYETDNELESFARLKLKVRNTSLFSSAKEHKILIKGKNVYMIVDTDENPILDTDRMDDLYERHQWAEDQGRSAANEMRRSENIDTYLGGYIGFRMWRSEGLKMNTYPSFSYMVGETKGKSTVNRKFKQAPRTKLIFVLYAEDESRIEEDVTEIIEMLKNVFGRFGEFETYPYPFKFLKEYLHKSCLESRGFNWDRLTKKSLNGIEEDEEDSEE